MPPRDRPIDEPVVPPNLSRYVLVRPPTSLVFLTDRATAAHQRLLSSLADEAARQVQSPTAAPAASADGSLAAAPPSRYIASSSEYDPTQDVVVYQACLLLVLNAQLENKPMQSAVLQRAQQGFAMPTRHLHWLADVLGIVLH